MGFKTNEIIELIHQRPGIRLVEIADQADLDLELVLPSIQGQIDSGMVLMEPVKAPNGRDTWSFKVSPEFAAEIQARANSGFSQAIAKPVSKKLESVIVPATEPKRLTNVDKAVAFIRAHAERRATSAELHILLGLQAHEYPSTYLKGGIDRGELLKDGKYWTLPSEIVSVAAPEEAATPPADDVLVIDTVNIQDYLPIPAGELDSAADKADFTCALWSDGMFQLVRGSKVFASLTAAETYKLRRYLERVDLVVS